MSITHSNDRDTYIIAKAMSIAIEVLRQERPIVQESDIADMERILTWTRMPTAFFRNERYMIDVNARQAIQEASQRLWAKRSRVVSVYSSNIVQFPEDKTT